ncbi:MAG: response regulator transcription factor [Spirochaetes bacterium]|nr:response regulator transcription factor [Spirochaetota bacterium]
MRDKDLRAGRRRVMIVDDHPLICKGLAQMIDDDEGLMCCGVADDINSAMKRIAEAKPDAVIVDISLKSSSGLDLIKAVSTRYPGLPCLVYSMHEESVFAERALKAGAKGYVMKDQTPEILIGALRKIIEGNIYFSDSILTRLVGKIAASSADSDQHPINRLTDRELEVLQLIGQELRNWQIAKKLNISVKTVAAHREHIIKKLGLDGAMELNRFAREWLQGNKPSA